MLEVLGRVPRRQPTAVYSLREIPLVLDSGG